MENKIKLLADSFGKDRVKFDESLISHTAIRSGGSVSLFIIAFTINEIVRIIKLARELKLPFLVFGTGSKILISDKGFIGVVIKNRTSLIAIKGIKGKVSKTGLGVDEALVEADSGTSILKLVEFLKDQNLIWQDLDGLSGSIGGNLFLNKELRSRVKSIKILDEYSDIEDVELAKLNLRKQIILSVILRCKSNQ